MSDIDPTPESPVTLPDRLAWWRGEQRDLLQQILAALTTPGGTQEGANVVAAIEAARGGSPLATVAGLAAYLATIEATVTTDIPLVLAALEDTAGRLDKIQSVLGAAPYSSLETGNIRALLYSLIQCCQKTGIDPDTQPGASTGSTGTTTTGGMRFITWPAIAGLNSTPGAYVLDPSGTWQNWYVYIQTDAPIAHMRDTGSPSTDQDIPANSWVAMSPYGSQGYAWWVESKYNAKGYIRNVMALLDTYVWEAADLEQWHQGASTYYGFNRTKYPQLNYVVDGGLTNIHGDVGGYYVTKIGEGNGFLWYGTTEMWEHFASTPGPYQLPDGTTYVTMFDDAPGWKLILSKAIPS